MGCRSDASIHDGTVKASLERVRDGLNATGRPILFCKYPHYHNSNPNEISERLLVITDIDAGNPTAGPKVYNPKHRGMPNNLFTQSDPRGEQLVGARLVVGAVGGQPLEGLVRQGG